MALHAYASWLGATLERGRDPSVQSLVAETTPAFERALASLESLEDGAYLHGHLAFDERLYAAARSAGIPIVFVYRDPRACLASLAHFMVERGQPEEFVSRLARRDVESAVRLLMQGDEAVVPFESFFAPYERWRNAEGVLALRFEDLIGPRGGGSRMRQYTAISAIAHHVGRREMPWRLLDVAGKTFNPRAGTFRRGTIDGWRQDLAGHLLPVDGVTLQAMAAQWGYSEHELPATPERTPATAARRSIARQPLPIVAMRRLVLSLLS